MIVAFFFYVFWKSFEQPDADWLLLWILQIWLRSEVRVFLSLLDGFPVL